MLVCGLDIGAATTKAVILNDGKMVSYSVLPTGQSVNVATDKALEEVAVKAIDRKLGARGLRMILEDLMLDLMYHLPSQRKLREFVVTEEMVKTHEISFNAGLLEKAG